MSKKKWAAGDIVYHKADLKRGVVARLWREEDTYKVKFSCTEDAICAAEELWSAEEYKNNQGEAEQAKAALLKQIAKQSNG